MKRCFLALSSVLVLLFASCSNAGSPEQRMKDSLDSIKNLKVESVQDAANQAIDTIKKSHDSLNKRIDSVADKTRDSMNQIKK
jgi:cellobiose-specific phosphotransferase system component IIA